ncbi:MAG: SDR family oxidoreductase [Alphaproteobacteria bacterium]|nr:SDR family oxidoreductase [Alphaproteobacteria bacterium]
MRIFCFGYGYVAQQLAAYMQNEDVSICGTTTTVDKADNDRIFLFDAEHAMTAEGQKALAQASHVIISIPPDSSNADPAWRHYGQCLQGKWLGYLSTTGVYGDWQGQWVDENSPRNATEPRSLRRIEAEKLWLSVGANCFRLAGIYGPKRNVLQKIRAGDARCIYKENQYFSRIHSEDIAQILVAAMQQSLQGEVFNLCDNMPAPNHEVIAYGCELLGVESPPLIAIEDANLSPMAQSFYAANRRVKNDKIKKSLSVTLKYRTYKDGLASLLHS